MDARGSRGDRWTFTVLSPGDWTPPLAFVESIQEPHYMVWQREVCPRTGTEHIQGYVRFNKRRYMKFVKEAFLNRGNAHVELAHGNEEQNKVYCSKEATRKPDTVPVELGEYDAKAGTQGRRSDLEEIAEKIKSNVSTRQIAEEYPGDFIRYHMGIEALAGKLQRPPMNARNVVVFYLYGPTGTGKTHRCRTQIPDLFEVMPGRDPWGGYSGQTTVLFDEFNWEKWSVQEMNKYLDKWPCKLDCRYRDTYAAWTRVVICANSPVEANWPMAAGPLRAALRRRITREIHVLDREQEIDLTAAVEPDEGSAPAADVNL